MMITIKKIKEDVKNPPKNRPADDDVTMPSTRSWTPSTVILVDVS